MQQLRGVENCEKHKVIVVSRLSLSTLKFGGVAESMQTETKWTPVRDKLREKQMLHKAVDCS